MTSLSEALASPATVTSLHHDFDDDGPLDARIAALTNLTELQLRKIPPGTVLPEEILGLPIRHLGMTAKGDALVVPELVRRMKLERLDVWDLDAAELPPMPSLRRLEIVVKDPKTEIAVLAERFSRLTHLEVWGSHLETGEVPDDIARFDVLESLHLVSCGVSDLPEALTRLPALQTLGIRGCPIKKFPLVLTRMPRLEALELKATLPGLPPEIVNMTGLKKLDLHYALNGGAMVSSFDDTTKLKALPRVLAELTWLEDLRLGCCGVFDIEVLRPLTKLRVLDVAWAGIESIAPLAGMTALEELTLDHCDRVKDLSPLASLSKLRELSLDNTEPRSLDVLRSLPSLKKLQIQGIECKSIEAIYDLDVELEADDEIEERYAARASLRGLPTIAALEQQLGARELSTVEQALAQLAAYGMAASTRGANALLALGIPVTGNDDDDGDDDDDADDDDDDDDDDEDDDDDDDDAEGDEDGVVHAGPYLPALDLALDRHLAQASPLVLAKLFCALFRETGDHFHAATRIAIELASRSAPGRTASIDDAQCALVDGFIAANEYYDTGHREHGNGTHDVLIDQVFPLLRGPALTKLVTWASHGHLDEDHGDGMLELIVPALERAPDPAPVLERIEKFVTKAIEYRNGPDAVERVWSLLAPISKGPIGDAIGAVRGRLEAKVAVAKAREDLAKRLSNADTAPAAIADAAKVSDAELEELQGALWRTSELVGLPRDARRQLFLLWKRRDRDDGIADAVATAARTAPAAELADDLLVLEVDRKASGKLLREAVLKALADDEFPPAAIEALRGLATEHDGMSRAAADSAELRAVLFGGAKRWDQEVFARGVAMLEALRDYVPEPPRDDDDDDDEYGNQPTVANVASMVANLAEGGEFELLGRFARNFHKLAVTGKPLERMLAQLVAVAIVGDDPGCFTAIASLIPDTVTWDILAYNLACKAAHDGDRAATLKYTGRALELGKSPEQFLADSDFKAIKKDPEFVALLDRHR